MAKKQGSCHTNKKNFFSSFPNSDIPSNIYWNSSLTFFLNVCYTSRCHSHKIESHLKNRPPSPFFSHCKLTQIPSSTFSIYRVSRTAARRSWLECKGYVDLKTWLCGPFPFFLTLCFEDLLLGSNFSLPTWSRVNEMFNLFPLPKAHLLE